MKTRFTFFLILFLLSGCATVKPIPQEDLNTIHRIGVVSILDDNLKLRHVGTTIFNNFDEDVSVTDWEIEDWMKDAIRKKLIEGLTKYGILLSKDGKQG